MLYPESTLTAHLLSLTAALFFSLCSLDPTTLALPEASDWLTVLEGSTPSSSLGKSLVPTSDF